MKEAFGNSFITIIVITFMSVLILILASSSSYSKAAKVRNRIIEMIEKYFYEKERHYLSKSAEIRLELQNVWDDFCDWYIELSKPALYGEDEKRKSDVLSVLCHVLENALKLLHPFIPFVTEEIYSNLPNTQGSIMVAEFPRYNSKAAYKKEAKAFEGVMGIIKAVRAMKKDADCPPSKKVELNVVTESRRLIQVNKDCIMKLSGASALNFVESAADVEGKTVSAITEIAQIYVPLGELVDLQKEKARLTAEIERIDGEIARAEGKLSNEKFVSKAPAKLVEAEKEKLEKYKDMKAKCVAQLESL